MKMQKQPFPVVGRGEKSLKTGGGGGGGGWLKKFRTLGITDLGGGVLLLGGKYPITCQGCSITNNCNEIFS